MEKGTWRARRCKKGGAFVSWEAKETGQVEGGGRECRGPTRPQSRWRECGKLDMAAQTKLKWEKGEMRGFKFHSDCKQGAQSLQIHSSVPGSAVVGRANSQEQGWCRRFSGHSEKGGSTAGRTFGRDCWSHLVHAHPRKWPQLLVLEQGR